MVFDFLRPGKASDISFMRLSVYKLLQSHCNIGFYLPIDVGFDPLAIVFGLQAPMSFL